MNHPDDRPDALPEDPRPNEGQVGLTPEPADVPVVPEGDVEPDSEPAAVAEPNPDAIEDPHEADFENISFIEEKRCY